MIQTDDTFLTLKVACVNFACWIWLVFLTVVDLIIQVFFFSSYDL